MTPEDPPAVPDGDPGHRRAGGDRHDRQRRFAPIGAGGQLRLGQSRVAVLGCGALGCASADMLVRAGVGTLRLIDRDLVEWSNLQRQGLFVEADAAAATPKAVAAAQRLAAIDGSVRLEPLVAEARAGNFAELIDGCDLVLDGLDTFATRHLLNEACMRARIPWIYGACVGAYGCSMPVVRGVTPCLRCLQDQLPAPGESPTCDSAGIIAPAVQLVAAWQVAEALKILTGQLAALRTELWTCDLWQNRQSRLTLAPWRDPDCAACSEEATFPLSAAGDDAAVVLCGRNAIQVRHEPVALALLAEAVGSRADAVNEHLVRWLDGPLTLTCFRDGRVIVQGTADPVAARAACGRWLG